MDSQENDSKSKPPSGRLGAVTRKRQEIEALMGDVVNNLPKIKELYTEYLVKVENLQEACGTEHIKWLGNYTEYIDAFRNRVEASMRSFSERRDPTPIKCLSTRSSSASSAASKARIKLAEERAAAQSKRSLILKKRQLDEKELQLKTQHEQNVIQLNSDRELANAEAEEERITILDQELSRLELDQSSLISETPNADFDTPQSRDTNIGSNTLPRQLGMQGSSNNAQPTVSPIVETEAPINRNVYFSSTPVFQAHVSMASPAVQSPPTVSAQSPFVVPPQSVPSAPMPTYLPTNNFSSVSADNRILEILQKQTEISQNMTASHNSTMLPKKDITPFDGTDITKFTIFMINFERIIESKCTTESDKLIYLEQFTKGKAQKIVKSCSHFSSSIGFSRAKQFLYQEYGNEFRVANAYIEKLDKWPEIKPEHADDLQELSIFLLDVQNYFENITFNNHLQSPKEIMAIVQKLPYRMREMWRRKTLHFMKNDGHVSFKHLVDFISEEVAVLSQPLFGTIGDRRERPNKSPKKRVLSTSVKEETTPQRDGEKYCEYCKKRDHYISSCKLFKALTSKDKSKFIQEAKLCFGCLRKGHISKNCVKRSTCGICLKRHPTVLHCEDISSIIKKPVETNISQITTIEPTPSTSSLATSASNDVISELTTMSVKNISHPPESRKLPPVVPAKVKVQGSDREILINVVLDNCASDCWLREDMLSKLGVSAEPRNVSITTMSDKGGKRQTRVLNNLIVSDVDGNFSHVIPVVYTKCVDNWPFSEDDLPRPEMIESKAAFQDIPFNFIDTDISLLVGLNTPRLLRPVESINGDPDGIYATRHALGWTICGPLEDKQGKMYNHRIAITKIHDNLDSEIDQFFSQDFFDSSDKNEFSVNDLKWLNNVESSIKKLNSNNFEVGLPFVDHDLILPDNRQQVLDRFMQLDKRFQRDKNLFLEYNKFMQTMIDREFMEPVPVNDSCPQGKRWYLVHHAVSHKRKAKIRVVLNCSLKYRGISLNDKLCQGPDLANNLLGVLLRFRENPVAVSADVEKMYYMVKVPVEDSNYLRLFWYDKSNNIAEYRLRVHVFGATSSGSVANYALKRTALEAPNENVKEIIERNFYVDDLLASFASIDECIANIKDVKNTVGTGGFNLTSFNSNCKKVLDSVPEADRSEAVNRPLIDQSPGVNTALGVTWDTKTDKLGYDISIEYSEFVTKRDVLKFVASIYDPLGLCSPVLIPGRKIFQELCRLGLGWDDIVPPEQRVTWKKYVNNVNQLFMYKVDRPLKSSAPTERIELHIFVDGSEIAYGAAAYMKTIYENSDVDVSLLASKARLTPLNNTTLKTIPRIELCSAKLGVELCMKLREELSSKIDSIHYWCDSQTVLRYIKSDSLHFKRFVHNKVCYIRNYSSPHDWHYVSTKCNPADMISRGTTVQSLIDSNLWQHGPQFLCNENDYPLYSIDRNAIEDDDELKVNTTVLAASIDTPTPTDYELPLW